MKKNQYVEYVLDLLEPFGVIKARAMFGGYGIYKDGIIFALVAEDVLYFKVDDHNRADYEERGSKPFTYQGPHNKIYAMSYWEVPIEVLEDRDEREHWFNAALKAAQRAKKVQKPKKTSKK